MVLLACDDASVRSVSEITMAISEFLAELDELLASATEKFDPAATGDLGRR